MNTGTVLPRCILLCERFDWRRQGCFKQWEEISNLLVCVGKQKGEEGLSTQLINERKSFTFSANDENYRRLLKLCNKARRRNMAVVSDEYGGTFGDKKKKKKIF